MVKLATPPRTQALLTKGFVPPPLDGSLDLQEIFDWHLANNSSHRLFIYATKNGSESATTITWGQTVRAAYRGVSLVRKRVAWTSGMPSIPTVAVLASTDVITYFTVLISIMRSNCVAFPISPRNSPSAVAHLLEKVGVDHLLVSGDVAMQQLAQKSLEILGSATIPSVSSFPSFRDLYLPSDDISQSEIPYYERRDSAEIVLYIHSSGSTSHPKPIPYSNLNNLQSMHIPWYGEVDLTDNIISAHCVPMFHIMGAVQIPSTASCGYTLAVFDPTCPSSLPTPELVIRELQATRSNFVLCVPAFAEAWSRNAEWVDWLSTRSGIISGGGGFNEEAGRYLTSRGVKIIPLYGSTETGAISFFMPGPEMPVDFEYFRLAEYLSPHFISQGYDNAFELVLKCNPLVTPTVINAHIDGVDAYATSDLLQPHPTRSGYWRVYGRIDDQIIHSTGEKTNAAPLERILNQDPHVRSCVLFGRGKPQAGVLVDPIPEILLELSDDEKLSVFKDIIWPTVQHMNEYAPQHSRIFKEMIIVASPSKPFTYTAKGTARRSAVINEYDVEIEALYDTLVSDGPDGLGLQPPSSWNNASTLTFVHSVILLAMGRSLSEEDDLFEHGCDSIQATWIRNALARFIPEVNYGDSVIARDFVYRNPSASSLVSALLRHISGPQSNVSSETSIEAMLQMRKKYGLFTGLHEMQAVFKSLRRATTILVTGTTGALGSHILQQLLEDDSVDLVYALNRRSPAGTDIRNRQKQAFIERGLDTSLLQSHKLSLLEGNLSEANFGLHPDMYNKIRRTVSHILHNDPTVRTTVGTIASKMRRG